MLLAEDLLLLVTDNASGRLSVPADRVAAGLGGAILVELTLRNKVGLTGEQDQGRPGRIIVRDPSTAGDAVLDAALEIVLAYQGKWPSTVIRPLSRNLRRTLYERLAGSGAVRTEPGRIFGVFPARRWPAQDASHEAEVRRLVTQALVQQVAPDTQTAALIARRPLTWNLAPAGERARVTVAGCRRSGSRRPRVCLVSAMTPCAAGPTRAGSKRRLMPPGGWPSTGSCLPVLLRSWPSQRIPGRAGRS